MQSPLTVSRGIITKRGPQVDEVCCVIPYVEEMNETTLSCQFVFFPESNVMFVLDHRDYVRELIF